MENEEIFAYETASRDSGDALAMKLGRLLTKANVLQAIVNLALDEATLDNQIKDRLVMKDGGRAVLLLISAFFEEEYGFRLEGLKREEEEKRELMRGELEKPFSPEEIKKGE